MIFKFDLTFFTNKSITSDSVIAHCWENSDGRRTIKQTEMVWPDHLYSLSHVALPFPPTDSLYGSVPENDEGLHIGQLIAKGEKGFFNISASDMLRLMILNSHSVGLTKSNGNCWRKSTQMESMLHILL